MSPPGTENRRVFSCVACTCDVRFEVGHTNSRFIKRGGYRFGDSKSDMAEDDTASTIKIRIGSEGYNYEYTRNADGMWTCCKGSEKADPDQVLVLARNERKPVWTAYEVVDPGEWENKGIPVFQYAGTGDPTLPGEHHWLKSWNRSRENPNWQPMQWAFWTVSIPQLQASITDS